MCLSRHAFGILARAMPCGIGLALKNYFMSLSLPRKTSSTSWLLWQPKLPLEFWLRTNGLLVTVCGCFAMSHCGVNQVFDLADRSLLGWSESSLLTWCAKLTKSKFSSMSVHCKMSACSQVESGGRFPEAPPAETGCLWWQDTCAVWFILCLESESGGGPRSLNVELLKSDAGHAEPLWKALRLG